MGKQPPVGALDALCGAFLFFLFLAALWVAGVAVASSAACIRAYYRIKGARHAS